MKELLKINSLLEGFAETEAENRLKKLQNRAIELSRTKEALVKARSKAEANGKKELIAQIDSQIKLFDELLAGIEITIKELQQTVAREKDEKSDLFGNSPTENTESEESEESEESDGTKEPFDQKESGESEENEENSSNKQSSQSPPKLDLNDKEQETSSSNPPDELIKNPFADPSDISFNNQGGSGGMPGALPQMRDPTWPELKAAIKSLQGEARKGVIAGIADILAKRNLTDSLHLKEALQKSLEDYSDDEFADMLNKAIDLAELAGGLKVSSDLSDRVAKIKQWSTDPLVNKELSQEDALNIQADRIKIKAREREANKYSQFKSLEQFKINFYNAIKNQVELAEDEDETYAVFNRRHDDTTVLKKGVRAEDKWLDDVIPSIDVYFDRSGSWSSEETDIGKRALASIAEFEAKGEIKLNIYYFDDYVTPNEYDGGLGRGGTGAWRDILQTIKQNKTKNVVIMTDHDMNYSAAAGPSVTVEGCVWFIWKNDISAPECAKHLQGKQGTYQYSFTI